MLIMKPMAPWKLLPGFPATGTLDQDGGHATMWKNVLIPGGLSALEPAQVSGSGASWRTFVESPAEVRILAPQPFDSARFAGLAHGKPSRCGPSRMP